MSVSHTENKEKLHIPTCPQTTATKPTTVLTEWYKLQKRNKFSTIHIQTPVPANYEQVLFHLCYKNQMNIYEHYQPSVIWGPYNS
jgi:hypothetical protein